MSVIEDLKYQYRVGGIANKLIYWNVALFAIPFVLSGVLILFNVHFDLVSFFSLSSKWSSLLYKPYSLISYMFFHAGFLHIFFNMVVLNFSSRLFLTYFTEKQFLGVYLLGGLFAGFIYLISYSIFPFLISSNSTIVGASGSIMAILFAAVAYNPLMQIRLFLFGNVKLWQIALILIIMDLIQLSTNNTGGHLAHLGGAIFGFTFVKLLRSGADLSFIVTKILDQIVPLFGNRKNSSPFKKVHKNFYTKSQTKSVSKIIIKDKNQQQIDDILDKISQSGYDSLSQAEKDFLFRSSNKF